MLHLESLLLRLLGTGVAVDPFPNPCRNGEWKNGMRGAHGGKSYGGMTVTAKLRGTDIRMGFPGSRELTVALQLPLSLTHQPAFPRIIPSLGTESVSVL
jgi:hypothetical protein